MKRVLLTGAGGLVGRHCLPLLRQGDYEVHAVSSRGAPDGGLDGVTWHQTDLLDEQQAEYRRRGGRFIVPIPELKVV